MSPPRRLTEKSPSEGALQSAASIAPVGLGDSSATDVEAHRWALILAGGDGMRLRVVTRAASGDDRPKQFCTLISHETLLASTRRRVDQAIPKERTILLLTEQHRPYFPSDLSELQPHQALLQPLNRGTAPAISWGLSQISALDNKAVVAIFPSDHHIADERRFVDFVLTALRAVESGVHQVVLLGISPDSAEPDYGWIEPDFADGSPAYPIAPVGGFCEKPSPERALELLARGWLWNSFVIIGEVASLIDLVHQTVAPLRVPFFPAQNGCDPL